MPGSEPREWLGYIRFSGRTNPQGETCMGTVEVTNRRATLQPRHLDIGGSPKADSPDQAGAHGEGLKLALLIMMRGRQNHRVRCSSGGFSWAFNFTNLGKLVAHLSRITPSRIRNAEERARKQCAKSLLPVAVSLERDVQFVIGEKGRGRDHHGDQTSRSPVTRGEFES